MLNIILILVTAILALVTGKLFLKLVKRYEIKQPIYEDAPERHQQKSGTPTLGAVVFLVPYLILSFILLFTFDASFTTKLLMFVSVIGFASVGIFDDLGKIRHNKNELGLSPKMKLLWQLIVTIIIIGLLISLNISTEINFILFSIDFSYFYYIIIALMFLGFSNASNLTDGLDGLLSSVTIVMLISLQVIYFINNNGALNPFLTILIVGLLVFLLFFNRYPAKMFMGDTGSLTLGGLYVLFIILLKVEFLGALFAVIYLAEVISVMMQTLYFKYTKKKYGEGRRIFKMAPLHHHFEQSGYSEIKIVLMFTIVQIIASILLVVVS